MDSITLSISTLLKIYNLNVPQNLLPLIMDTITALKKNDIEKTVFAANRLISKYCTNLIDSLNIECPDIKTRFDFQKIWYAKKFNLLDESLYSIWSDIDYVASALDCCLDFGEPLREERIKETFDCIQRFGEYMSNKYPI